MTNVLEVFGLAAGYRNLPVLREVSFGVAPGELWAILGPNGAGKSTLLRACLDYTRRNRGALRCSAGRLPIGPEGSWPSNWPGYPKASKPG